LSDRPERKPYSRLPETFALMAMIVGLDLVAMAWPVSNVSDFLLRTIGYAVMLTTAATHSWFFAQRALWSNASNAVVTTFMWLVVLSTGVFAIEWYAGGGALGWVAFAQIVLCSFLFNHATLRMTHFVAFLVMILASTRLPLGIGGAAWVVFAILSMLVLAYDRTARKAGPSGYDRGEYRWPVQRIGVVSAVATFSALLFLVTPLLKWPDFDLSRKPQPQSSRGGRPFNPTTDPFRIGGNTDTPDPRNDRLPVMRVSLEPMVGSPVYVRGQSFDTFDGASWSNDDSDMRSLDVASGTWTKLPVEQPAIPASVVQVRQSYEMLVDLEGVVFTAFRPASLRFADGSVDSVNVDESGRTVRIDGAIKAHSRYDVDGIQDVFAKGSLVVADRSNRRRETFRDLQVPAGIDARVKQIAIEQTTGATTDYDKAVALERYLRRSYYYSLSHDVSGPQVVNDFMLRTKRGHCALFASSMVVMARSVGLPARYVTGFLAQERTLDGFIVRGSDGHAWVEVYIDGAGWLSFDPTSGTIEPGDTQTQALTADNGREDVRVSDPRFRPPGGVGGGLYGRGDRDRDGGDPRGGDIARNDGNGVGGSGNGAAGSADGSQGGAGGTDGGSSGTGGDGGTVNGGDLGRNGDRQSGSAGTSDGGSAGGGGGGSGSGASPTVIPPGGDTSLPQGSGGTPGGAGQGGSNGSGSASGTAGGSAAGTSEGSRGSGEAPSTGTSKPIESRPMPKQPDVPPDAKAVERDWSLLVWLLAGLGIVGLALLGIWTFGVRRVTEKRQIREALPLTVEDDPDPRRLIVKLYHAMVGGLGRVGFVRKDGTTPAEYAASVAHREPALAEPVGQLTDLFHDARYDGVPVTRAQADQARSVWRRIATSVKRVETTAD
jgi:uncharacterized membrane protein YgcG